jgi:hypothetical protein
MKNPNGYGGISKLPGNRPPQTLSCTTDSRLAVSNRWQTTAKISHTWLLYQQTRCPNRTCRLQQTPLRLKSAAYHFRRALQPVV